METTCHRCGYLIRYEGEAPRFCSKCGASLLSTSDGMDSTIDAATRPPSDSRSKPEFSVDLHNEDWVRPGDQVGTYIIEEQLGRGGMGVVYRATHETTGKRVAIKFLNQSPMDSPKAVERFHRESKIAASISNPRSTFVYASGEYAGRRYIVMELMPGDTLKDLVKSEGALPVGHAVDLILDVITGIQSAHRRGIIHRDIKPSNCFLDHDGRVKIGDYGLSKSFESDVQLTKTGTFMGTLQFAAPEQIKGAKVDERTDIYAIGATLYYLIAGNPPYDGDAAQVIAGIASDPVPDIRKQSDNVARKLGRLIMQMLEKDPRNRPQNLGDLRKMLLPFATRGANTADIGRRFAAFFVDYTFANTVITPLIVSIVFFGSFLANAGISQPGGESQQDVRSVPTNVKEVSFQTNTSQAESGIKIQSRPGNGTTPDSTIRANPTDSFAMLFIVSFLAPLLYFAVGEGIWGRTLGKLMFGMRTVDEQGGPPGIVRSLIRACMLPGFMLAVAFILPLLIQSLRVNPTDASPFQTFLSQVGVPVFGWTLTLCLLIPARTRNGFQGYHGKLTGTRVVRIGSALETQGFEVPVTLPNAFEDQDILDATGLRVKGVISRNEPSIFLAKDKELERYVWLVQQARSSIPDRRLAVNRPHRQRLFFDYDLPDQWVTMEAITGSPLVEVIMQIDRLNWEMARLVLEELVDELRASLDDRTLPTDLSPSHIWLDEEGNVKLVDYCPPVHQFDKIKFSGNAEQKCVECLSFFLEMIRRKERLPFHAVELTTNIQGREPNLATLDWIRNELRESEKMPAQWRWDDRLGTIVASLSTEFSFTSIFLVSISMLLHFGLGIGSIGLVAINSLVVLAITFFLGFRFSGGPVFKLCGVQVSTMNDNSASKLICGIRNVLVWLPLSVLNVLNSALLTVYMLRQTETVQVDNIGVMMVLNFGLLAAGAATVIGFVFALAIPHRSIPDFLLGTRIGRK